MKRIYFLASFIILISLYVFVSADSKLPTLITQGKSIESFIPVGWKLINKTEGDLNKDGLIDIAGVLELNREYEMGLEAPPRILFVAFKDKNGIYRLSIQSEKAILKADQGGVWGDPFVGISVDRGSILIQFYGGSNYRWAYTYRFRFQDNGWYLIGATIENYFTGTGEGIREDYNLLTGIMIKATFKLEKTIKEETINRGKKKLLNLKDFNAGEENEF
ncbi:MAG: hypothetical protein ACM3YE_16395 [Bacteroidota bacterium]